MCVCVCVCVCVEMFDSGESDKMVKIREKKNGWLKLLQPLKW